MPKSLITLNLLEGALSSIGDLTVLPNFRYIYLKGNSLETITDLLNGVPNLLNLYIRRNSRMSCDRRMCLWRLWERVRTPVNFDDVTCQQPSDYCRATNCQRSIRSLWTAMKVTSFVCCFFVCFFISNIFIQGGPFSYTLFYHRALLKHENKLKCMLTWYTIKTCKQPKVPRYIK